MRASEAPNLQHLQIELTITQNRIHTTNSRLSWGCKGGAHLGSSAAVSKLASCLPIARETQLYTHVFFDISIQYGKVRYMYIYI